MNKYFHTELRKLEENKFDRNNFSFNQIIDIIYTLIEKKRPISEKKQKKTFRIILHSLL